MSTEHEHIYDSDVSVEQAIQRCHNLGEPSRGDGWRRLLFRVAKLLEAREPNSSIEQSPAPVSQRVLTKGGEEDPWVVARLAAWKKKPPTNDDPEDDDATKNARADLREEMDACGWDIYGGSDYHIIVGMNYAWEEGFLEARAQSYRNPTPPSQELIRAVDAAAPSTPTVEEIMEVVMSRVRANADGVGYVTFYINDEGKVFENKLRSHLSKLHQQKGQAPSSKGE